MEIIALLGIKSPFSIRIHGEQFFYISKKLKLEIVLFMSIYIP
jgi:hypothetical protein